MVLLHLNEVGIFAVRVGVATAVLICHLAGIRSDTLWTLIFAITSMACDLGYRLSRPDRSLLSPRKGGALLGIPMWCLSAV